MSEKALWKTFRRELGLYGKLVRIENKVSTGIPDVSYVLRLGLTSNFVGSGWVELKYLSAFPTRNQKVVLEKLRREQVVFAEEWEGAGGTSVLLVQVGKLYYMFNSVGARRIFERTLDRADFIRHAKVSGSPFPTATFLRYLAGVRNAPTAFIR